MNYLTKDAINAWSATPLNTDAVDRRAPLRTALTECGQLTPNQTAGRFFPIACVALEITQRCNLDCALCYLSDRAEAAHDVPMKALLRRVDVVEQHYGPGTSIQITGGDPTLRSVEDIETLCRYIRAKGMRSCLMTNGIRATKSFLIRLAEAGLDDVAFHVDLTQDRKGYPTESSLNTIREDYIARAKAAGLRILFNTTIFDGNRSEVPAIARFFREHAADVTLVSFQMEAMTGRGRIRDHSDGVNATSVQDQIEEGIGTEANFGEIAVGHTGCTQFAAIFVAGDRATSALGNPTLVDEVLARLELLETSDWATSNLRTTILRTASKHPVLTLKIISHVLGRVWKLRHGLMQSRGRVHRMSIMLHNFMDAEKLEEDRCKSCVFMVATDNGPISMCVYNARRDAHLFAPVNLGDPENPQWWSAQNGKINSAPEHGMPENLPYKRLKGHLRAQAARSRLQKVRQK